MKKRVNSVKAKIVKAGVALVLLRAIFFVEVFVLAVNLRMVSFAKPYVYTDVSQVPEQYAVIVPGGKVYPKTVSYVVRDRIDAAVKCLENGKCQRVLISGDHGQKNYDEVNVMRRYMQEKYGVESELIFMDHAGFSTYETMYRAKEIYGVEKAVVVTQKFHVARSVYIGRKLGLDVVAYVAPELTGFRKGSHLVWNVRECLARTKNFFLVKAHARPTYLGEKIPITGNSKLSWDVEE